MYKSATQQAKPKELSAGFKIKKHLLEYFFNKQVDDFHKDEYDDDPFQHNAVAVLKQVFK